MREVREKVNWNCRSEQWKSDTIISQDGGGCGRSRWGVRSDVWVWTHWPWVGFEASKWRCQVGSWTNDWGDSSWLDLMLIHALNIMYSLTSPKLVLTSPLSCSLLYSTAYLAYSFSFLTDVSNLACPRLNSEFPVSLYKTQTNEWTTKLKSSVAILFFLNLCHLWLFLSNIAFKPWTGPVATIPRLSPPPSPWCPGPRKHITTYLDYYNSLWTLTVCSPHD